MPKTTDQGGARACPTSHRSTSSAGAARSRLDEHFDDAHGHGRALARAELAFDLLYDDEPEEPDPPIRDALTDLMHSASARGVDFTQALADASRMHVRERRDWGLRDLSRPARRTPAQTGPEGPRAFHRPAEEP